MTTLKDELLARAELLDSQAEQGRESAATWQAEAQRNLASAAALALRAAEYRALAEKA